MNLTHSFTENTIALGEELTNAISEQRRVSWQTLIELIDMTHNSKKAWSTICKLCNHPCKSNQQYNTTANQVAHQLLLNGRVPKKQSKVRLDRQMYPGDLGFTRSFTVAELEDGITALKNGKAPGLDDIQTELIRHLGPKARNWLLKPGKDLSEAKSFRPIPLLCHTYKLFQRLILNRLTAHADG